MTKPEAEIGGAYAAEIHRPFAAVIMEVSR